MSGFSTFELGGASTILSAKSARWKPQKGKYRVSFVTLPGIENGHPDHNAKAPLFKGGRRLYHKDVGYFIDHGPEYAKLAGEPSKVAIATVIVLWPTDANGVIDMNRLKKGEFDPKSWIFSLDKYRQLEAIQTEFPLTQHDVTITVTDPQFHKMSFAPCKDNLFTAIKAKEPNLYASVVEVVKDIYSRLQDDVAQDLTLDQVREKLSGAGGATSPVAKSGFSSSFSADDVLSNVLDD
jgi:hypothetical protein